MDGKTCGDCLYFRRHYVKTGREFEPLEEGHCSSPRARRRRASNAACGHFRPCPDLWPSLERKEGPSL